MMKHHVDEHDAEPNKEFESQKLSSLVTTLGYLILPLNFWVAVRMQKVSLKGGDPATPSGTATLLRLHPSHQPCLRHPPPCG